MKSIDYMEKKIKKVFVHQHYFFYLEDFNDLFSKFYDNGFNKRQDLGIDDNVC